MPYSRFTDFLYPAKSVKLTTVAHFAIQGALGHLPSDQPIISNQTLLDYEAKDKQN